MRVAIVGTGAMGGLFAANLASAGIDLWCIDIRQSHVDAIAAGGLRVATEGTTRPVALQISTDPHRPGQCDAVIVFTKYGDTAAALKTMAPLLHPATLLVTLQNGIGNVALIQAAFPHHRVLLGLTTATASLVGPGQIWTTGLTGTQTHAWPLDGRCDAAVEQLAARLVDSGIPFFLSADIEVQIWKKLIVNCALNTSCAIAGMTVGEVTALPQAWPVLLAVADEIVAVAQAKGMSLTRGSAHQYLRDVAKTAASHLPSMAADIRAGRPTEIDSITGAVLREGARLTVPTPVVQTLDLVVRLVERRSKEGLLLEKEAKLF